MATVFEKIISREIPADIVFENERLIAFHDIAPKGPIHLLIVTKKVIPSLQEMAPEDLPLLGEMTQLAQQLASQHGVADGYRLLTNIGPNAGQTVFHLHFHLIGGKTLGPMA